MLTYLLKRILLFVPTLLVISLLAFGLSRVAPGDPVSQYLGEDVFGKTSRPEDLLHAEKGYAQAAANLQLDRPAFYFSISPKAYPDTLHRIAIQHRRVALEKLVGQYGNWPQVEAWHRELRQFDLKFLSLPDSLKAVATPIKQPLREMYGSYLDGAIMARLTEIEVALGKSTVLSTVLGTDFSSLKKSYDTIKATATPQRLYWPALHWYGTSNQYHAWLSNFVKGDFGTSLHFRQPVGKRLKPALFWTLVVNVAAIALAFLVAVPLGIWSAVKQGKTFDKITTAGLFMAYSLPAFWVATLLLVFFTTREFGMDIFPGPGLGELPPNASRWVQLWHATPHLVLPIACLAYPSLAFIARQARGSMAKVLTQDYIRTARSKGLTERQVIWKHGLRNAVFPLITLLGSIVPSAIAGSVAIEVIFNIPGMGKLSYEAIFQNDWPIVFTVLMLGALLTVVGMLLADILYRWADPRVKY